MAEERKPQVVRERIEVCELDLARLDLMTPALIEQNNKYRTSDEAATLVIDLTTNNGIETVWGRYEIQQIECKYYKAGIPCQRCAMSP